MKRVIGIGNALVDIVTCIDNDNILTKLDLPKGSMNIVDTKKAQLVKDTTRRFSPSFSAGGSAANTIHGLGSLGVEAGFIGCIGDDDTGVYFDKGMKKVNVETFLRKCDTPTGACSSLVSPDSERTMATHLGAAVQVGPEDVTEERFNNYDILYLEGYLIPNRELMEKACEIAKGCNMEIAIDMASYNVVEENIDFFDELIQKYVNIVFANEEEAKAYTGKDAEDAIIDISSKVDIAIVKTGKKGSLVKRGEEFIRFGSMDVDCIDTTGAGDLFASGFLYGYVNDYDMEKCGLCGTLLAGNVIQVMGAKMDSERWLSIKDGIAEIESM